MVAVGMVVGEDVAHGGIVVVAVVVVGVVVGGKGAKPVLHLFLFKLIH